MKERAVTKKILMALIVGIFIFMGLSPGWCGKKPTEWRFYTFLPEKRAELKDVKAWADRIYQRSGERLKITVYPGGALGFKPPDMLRIMKAGFIESGYVYDGYLYRDEPSLASLIVQGVFLEPEDYKKVIDIMKGVKKKIYTKWGIVWVGIQQSFGKWIYVFSKEPIKSLEDMRAKKIRVWAKDQVETLTSLGVSAQVIPQSEMYVALKTGVVDGALYPPTAAKALSLYEVVKYGSRLYPYSTSFSNYVVSKSAWDAISDDLRAVILEAGDWVFEETTKKYRPEEKYTEIVEFLKGKGMVFLDPFPEKDRRLVRKSAWEVWENMSKKAGPEAVKNFNEMKEALSK